MPTPRLVLTIAPERNGKTTLLVSLRNADGTASLPRAISVDHDGRLGAFVAAVQAIVGQQLASIKSSAIGRTGDGDPAIADTTHGEQVR